MAIETQAAECPSCGELNEVEVEMLDEPQAMRISCQSCGLRFAFSPQTHGEASETPGEHETDCPYCGEANSITVEPLSEQQSFIEDCRVCCRPIQYTVQPSKGELEISAARSD